MARKTMHLKIVAKDQLLGPLPLETVIQMAAEGRLSADDLVRPGGYRGWLRVTEVAELAAHLQMPPPEERLSRTDCQSVPQEPAASAEPVATAGDEPVEARAPIRLARRRVEDDAAMEMAPMIDVTFLLLIFFMLTNSLANPAAMDVPAAVHGRGVTLEGQQLILVDQDGRTYLGSTPSPEAAADSLDALVKEVAENARKSRQPLEVIVSAHRNVKHRHVRELVEGLAKTGELGPIRLAVEEKLK
jgi:biopolymer transport protein ExbD